MHQHLRLWWVTASAVINIGTRKTYLHHTLVTTTNNYANKKAEWDGNHAGNRTTTITTGNNKSVCSIVVPGSTKKPAIPQYHIRVQAYQQLTAQNSITITHKQMFYYFYYYWIIVAQTQSIWGRKTPHYRCMLAMPRLEKQKAQQPH